MNPEKEVVEFLQELVRQSSVSGHEAGASEVAASKMRSLGFDDVWQDEIGNVVGVLKGQTPGPKVMFDAHTDVVPVTTPEAWQRPPFSGVLESGRVWGRGACDNKGSLAAMIVGLAALPRDALAGTLYLTATVGEETLEGVGLGPVVDVVKPGCVIIGEPTDCRLGFCQRGRARLTFRVPGKAGHSSSNDQSGNAVYAMARLAAKVEKLTFPKNEWLGQGSQAPIELISDPYPSLSTVPVECRMTVDRRLMPGETETSILADYRQAIGDLPGATVELDVVTYTSYTGKEFTQVDFHPAWVTLPDSPFVQACLQSLRSADIPAELYPIPYCTNGSYSAGALGIPAIVFGPGSVAQAHARDEYLEVTQLQSALRGYQAVAKELGKTAKL